MKAFQTKKFISLLIIFAIVVQGYFFTNREAMPAAIMNTAANGRAAGGKQSQKGITGGEFISLAIKQLTFEHGDDPLYVAEKNGYVAAGFDKSKVITVGEASGIISRITGVTNLNVPSDPLTADTAKQLLDAAQASWYAQLESEPPAPLTDFSTIFRCNEPEFEFSADGKTLIYNERAMARKVFMNLENNTVNSEDTQGFFETRDTSDLGDMGFLGEFEVITNVVKDRNGVARVVCTTTTTRTNYVTALTVYYRKSAADKFGIWWRSDTGGSEIVDILAFTDDNERLYVKTNLYDNYTSLYAIKPETWERRLVYGNQHADIMSDRSRKTDYFTQDGRLAAVTYEDDKPHIVFIDEGLRAVMDKVYAAGFDAFHFPVAMSPSFERLVLFHSTDTDMGTYILYDARDNTSRVLGKMNMEFDDSSFVKAYPVSFKSRDGATVYGFLRIPRGKSPRNLPLMTEAHGGPDLRFRWNGLLYGAINGQYFANRGIASLQIDFRQSLGYGKAYYEAGNGNNILRQNDITDGALWAVESGVADPARVGIFGISYGGYSAYYQAARRPDIYKAAIAYSGVFDWNSFIADFGRGDPIPTNINRIFCDTNNPERLTTESPSTYVNDLRCPIFIIYGARDGVVPPSQNEAAIEALKTAGNEPDVLCMPHDGHIVSRSSSLKQMYEAMDVFLSEKFLSIPAHEAARE